MLTYPEVVAAFEAKGWSVRLTDPDELLDGEPLPLEEGEEEDEEAFFPEQDDTVDEFVNTYEVIVDGKKLYFELLGNEASKEVEFATMLRYDDEGAVVRPWFPEEFPVSVEEFIHAAETFHED